MIGRAVFSIALIWIFMPHGSDAAAGPGAFLPMNGASACAGAGCAEHPTLSGLLFPSRSLADVRADIAQSMRAQKTSGWDPARVVALFRP